VAQRNALQREGRSRFATAAMASQYMLREMDFSKKQQTRSKLENRERQCKCEDVTCSPLSSRRIL